MKRQISEIFDNLTPGTSKIIGQYGIKTEVDEVTKRRIYNSVMSEINARESKMPKVGKKFNKVAVVAAACIAAMTIGGVSAGASTLYKSFSDYKPAYTEAQKAVIDEARFAINKQSSTNDAFNGITFTATEGMWDDRVIYVMLNVECDPSITGSTKDKGITISSELSVGGFQIYGEVLNHEGDTYTVLLGYDVGGNITDGQEIELSIGGVSIYTPVDESETGKIYCDDQWAVSSENNPTGISFTVNGKKANFGRQFYTEKQISFMNHDTDIDLGYISPWCGNFSLYSKGDDYDSFQIEMGTPDVKITMNDGTVYTNEKGIKIHSDGASQNSTNNHGNAYVCRWYFGMTFDDYINTLDIKSFEINGVEVDIGDVDMSKHYAGLDYYWSTEY